MAFFERWLQESPTSEAMDFPEHYKPNGWIYILSNKSMPNIFKVGLTTTSPKARAGELSSSSGVPEKFEIERVFISESPSDHEKLIHKELGRYRVNDGREFFKCPVSKIISVCERIIPDGNAKIVNDLSDKYNFISFESLGDPSPSEIIQKFGINHFGDDKSTLIRLAMFGAEFVRHLTRDGGAVVLNDHKFNILLPEGTDEI